MTDLSINLGWPQVILITLIAFNFIGTCFRAGKPKKTFYNPVGSIIDIALLFTILYFGGFFS